MRCVKTPTWTPPLRPAAEEISIVVVLPAPLGPRKAKISPLRTSRSIPPTASSPHVRSNILSVTPSGHAALTPLIQSAMSAAAVTAPLPHTIPPVLLVGATTGATAQIGLQAHITGQPQE